MNQFTINTDDDYTITATYFRPEKPNGTSIVISGGVGMPQRFFFNFAQWLSEQGCDAYTFDFRGVGLSKPKSLKRMQAGYKEWANFDFVSITQYVKNSAPENKMYHIGHSFGGNSLGMSQAFKSYDRFLTVGSQFGYYRNFPWHMQLSILLGFGVMTRVLSPIYGYFPSNLIGLGEPLPSQVAADWGTLLLHKDSVLELSTQIGGNYYSEITQPILMISIDDDNFAPKKSVDVLASEVFINAGVERRHLIPREFELKKIGHNDFFRKRHKERLWPIVSDWFEL